MSPLSGCRLSCDQHLSSLNLKRNQKVLVRNLLSATEKLIHGASATRDADACADVVPRDPHGPPPGARSARSTWVNSPKFYAAFRLNSRLTLYVS